MARIQVRTFATLALLLLVPVLAPAEATPAPAWKVAESQPIATLAHGYLRDRTLEEYLVFTDETAFDAYWVAYVGPTTPRVDFETEMVLVAVRQDGTARCNYRIQTVIASGAEAKVTNVYVTGTLPYELLICAPHARFGAHLVTIPRLDGTVVFHAMHGEPLAIVST